jgi:anti-sigma factor RsiW
MSPTRLQDLYAEALARRRTAPGGCVSPEDLLSLIRQEGPEARRLEVLDHVMACRECHREFELLRALDVAGARERSPVVRSIGRRLTPLALAASLLLAIGIGLSVRSRARPEDIPRGGPGNLVLLAPPTEVAAGQPVRFAWRPVPSARRYQLEVLDANGAAVFSELTGDTTLTWPADRLQPGSTYRWWVRDVTPGAELSSPLRSLRLRRK